MVTITARIPERTMRSASGKAFRFPARTERFIRDADGQWWLDGKPVREAEVIDICRMASNWREIHAGHFTMEGFHA